MAEGSQTSRNVWRIGFYLVLAALLMAGILFAGASMLRASDEPVQGATSPTVTSAPKPVSKSVAEKIRAREQAAKERAAKAAKEKAAKEQAKKEEKAKPKQEQASVKPVHHTRQVSNSSSTNAPVPSDTSLYLTIPAAGRYNDPVVNSIAPAVLDNGAGKLPSSGFPWQPGANTYIAAHVYGYEGTGSWQQFAGLINVRPGDQIILTDSNGTDYNYTVTETMAVSPYDTWVTAPVPGKTVVTLQTCTGPGWSQRLIVRGELVS